LICFFYLNPILYKFFIQSTLVVRRSNVPQTRFSLALLLVILLSVAVITRNSETAGSVTYYLHRTGVLNGKTIDTTAPSGAETTLSMRFNVYHYWYTDPPLRSGTISTGTWTLRVYVSWSGRGRGTFNLDLVSQGGVIKATIVPATTGPDANNPTGWYQVTAEGSSVTVAENDRVRLGLMFSKTTTLYYDGNTGNEVTEQSRLMFTGSAPPPIPESPLFGTLALALIAFTVYVLHSKRILIKFKRQ